MTSSALGRCVRVAAIAALVLLVPVALHSVWDYIEIRRLIAEIEAIRDRGEPVTRREAHLRSILPPAPLLEPRRADDGTDAGTYYMAATRLAGRLQPHGQLFEVDDWLAGVGPAPPLARTAERLRGRVERQRDTLALADAAASLTFSGLPAEMEDAGIFGTGGLVNVGELMAIRTVALSLAGESDRAVASAISRLRLQDVLGDARSLFASGPQVHAILSLAPPAPEALRRLEAALAAADRPDEAVERVMQQRARYLEMFWVRYYGPDPSQPRDYRLPRRSVSETVIRPWWTHLAVDGLRMWAELVEAARTPWPQRLAAAEDVSRRYRGTPPRNPAWALLTRPYVAGTVALRPFEASVRPDGAISNRTSRAAVAVERYRRDHDGALPSALSDLVPDYLERVPADPMTGRDLGYRVEADAYRIYSVGYDRKDDGGVLRQETPPTARNRFMQGPDLGVRVLTRQALTPGPAQPGAVR